MNKVILFFIFIFALVVPGFAQSNSTESLTITTYYPAPYGVYRYLKLTPTDTVPSTPALTAGVMYYSNSANMIKYYNNSGAWVNLSGGGGGGRYWALNNIAGNPSIYNTNAGGSVGIGTNNPQQRLDVNGAMRLAPLAVPPTVAEGSMYYNRTLQTPCYHDGTQWNSFISEYNAVDLPAGTDSKTISFRKPYANPPIVLATIYEKEPHWAGTAFIFIKNLTEANVTFELSEWDSSPPPDGTWYESTEDPVEIHYIVIPQ